MNYFTLKGLDSIDYEYVDNDDKIYNDDNYDDEDKIENTRWIITPWKDSTTSILMMMTPMMMKIR